MADSIVDQLLSEMPRQSEPSIVDRLLAEKTQPMQRAPAPVDPSTGLPVQGEGGVPPEVLNAPLTQGATEMGQMYGRTLIQMGLAMLGTGVGGAVGGPPGAIAGGTIGSVAGGQGYDLLTGGQPSVEGAGMDAVSGALGPVLAGTPRALGRLLVGANVGVRDDATMAAGNTLMDEMHRLRAMGRTQRTPPTHAEELAMSERALASSRESLRQSMRQGETWTGRVFDVGALGPGAFMLVMGDFPTAVGLLAGGASASYGRRQLAEGLLHSDRFIRFIMRPEMGNIQNVAGILGAAAGTAGEGILTAEERQMARTLMQPENTLGRQSSRGNPFSGVLTVETPRGPRGRDEITGRFTSLTGNE